MGLTWNSSIPTPNALQWQDATWDGHLANAVNQRGVADFALSVDGGAGSPLALSIPSGTDVQSHDLWFSIQEDISLRLSIGLHVTPPNVGTGSSAWLDTGANLDPTGGWNSWGEQSLRTSLGFSNGVNRDGSTPLAYWQRQRPRSIALPADASDTDGNTIANGQIGWLLGSERATVLAKRVDPIPDPSVAPRLQANEIVGGRVPAAAYFVKYTWYNGTGETLPSPSATTVLRAAGTITVTLPALPSGAKLAIVYVGTLAGGEGRNDTTSATTMIVNNFGGRAESINAPASNQTQWIPAGPADVPDRLNSDNAPAGNLHVDPGMTQPRDYITPEMLIELRAVLNAETDHGVDFPLVTSPGAGTISAGSSASKAGAIAAYPGGVAGAFWRQGGETLGYSVTQDNELSTGVVFGPPPAYAVETASNTVSITVPSPLAATVDYWVWPEVDNAGQFDPVAFAPPQFNAQGSGLAQNQWQPWTSVGPTTGAATSPAWTTPAPANWPTPAPGQVAQAGYLIGQNGTGVFSDITAVAHFNVIGGFDETLASP